MQFTLEQISIVQDNIDRFNTKPNLTSSVVMKQQISKSIKNQSKYLFYIIIVRIILCLSLMNRVFPDQTYQGPQVAHQMTFGFGTETWQYSNETPIRNRLYPSLISVVYQVLKLLGLDNTILLMFAHKIFQIIIAVLFDYYLLKLNRFYNKNSSGQILVINYCNTFVLDYMCRTFNNSTEATISIIAFYLWKKRNHNYCDFYSRLLVTMGFIVRPTILILWASVWIYELLAIGSSLKVKIRFIGKNLLTIICFFSASIIISFYFQGRFIFTEFNFLKINVIDGVSSNFGRSPFWQYGKQLAMGLNLLLIPLFFSLKQILVNNKGRGLWKFKELIIFSFLVVLFFSAIAHKQLRFIILIFPFFFIIANKVYSEFNRKIKILFVIISVIIHCTYFYQKSIKINIIGLTILNDLRNDPTVTSIFLIHRIYSTPIYTIIHKNVEIQYENQISQDADMKYRNKTINQLTQDDPQKLPSHIVLQSSQLFWLDVSSNRTLVTYYEIINRCQTEHQNEYIEVYRKMF